jgi:hypothetical protein
MPTEAQKAIARHVAGVWKGRPKIIEMRAEGTKHVQAFAQLVDFPVEGLVAYSTIGLSDSGTLELATLSPTKYKSVSKSLFDVASYVAAGGRTLRSEEVFEKVLGRYYPRSDAAHWLVRSKAREGIQIPAVELPGRRVSWVYAWPVTSDELIWHREGHERQLDALLDSAGLHSFDLGRRTLEQVPNFDAWAKQE